MQVRIDAIYENGVLRPLEPLVLPEQSRVHVIVSNASEEVTTSKVEKQKAAWKDVWKELQKIPQAENQDGWSARDHDDILYGPKQ